MTAQTPDTKPGDYYVSVIDQAGNNGAGRYALMLGPFKNNHAEALAMVDEVRKVAEGIDPRAVWYLFGTCRLDTKPETEVGNPPGKLNSYLFYPNTLRDISGRREARRAA